MVALIMSSRTHQHHFAVDKHSALLYPWPPFPGSPHTTQMPSERRGPAAQHPASTLINTSTHWEPPAAQDCHTSQCRFEMRSAPIGLSLLVQQKRRAHILILISLSHIPRFLAPTQLWGKGLVEHDCKRFISLWTQSKEIPASETTPPDNALLSYLWIFFTYRVRQERPRNSPQALHMVTDWKKHRHLHL